MAPACSIQLASFPSTTWHGVTLAYTLTIRGDPGASTSTTAVWDSFAALADRQHGVQVNSTYQRAVLNRRTGQLLDCCGAAVNDDTRVRQAGIGLFWRSASARPLIRSSTSTPIGLARYHRGTASSRAS